MTSNVRAELISIGTELLLGEITDTNSVYMARALRDIGINVFYMISVGDNRERIAETIRTSLKRSDIVITCGGLGPTVDDMTRQSIADATDRELVFEPHLMDLIRQRFEKYGVTMSENNRRQAFLPDGAIAVENPVGTAPAFIVEVGEKCVISLPGVPREMKFLFNEQITPYLRKHYGITEQIILARILKTGGIGESTLDTMIDTDLLEGSNPTVGLAAHSGQIDIRITAKADTQDIAAKMIDSVEAKIRAKVNQYIFGTDDAELPVVFAKLLKDNSATISISETGIGGVIQKQISEPMAHQLILAETHNSPEELAQFLNKDDSNIESLARAAADEIRTRSSSTVSIAVVSQPNIDEGEDNNVGTAVVVSSAEKTRHRVYGFGGQSESVQIFVGNWSTAVAWRMVSEALENA